MVCGWRGELAVLRGGGGHLSGVAGVAGEKGKKVTEKSCVGRRVWY